MRKRKRNRKRKKFLPLLLPALLTVLCFFLLEKNLLPPLKEISHMQCKAAANHIIDEAAANALARMELDASALLQKGADGESYTANTTCVNQFCALLSRDITKQLNELPKEVIPIPLGAATHWGLLANQGPKIPFTLLPMGAVRVDYENGVFLRRHQSDQLQNLACGTFRASDCQSAVPRGYYIREKNYACRSGFQRKGAGALLSNQPTE